MSFDSKEEYRNFIIKKYKNKVSISHKIAPAKIQKIIRGSNINILIEKAKDWIDREYRQEFIIIEHEGYCSCGSFDLDYKDVVLEDPSNYFYRPFECKTCGKKGREYHQFNYSDTIIYN